MWLAVLIIRTGDSEEVIEQLKFMADDVFFPNVVLELEILFLDDIEILAAGFHADVREEEQLSPGIERCEIKRHLVDRLQHSCREFWCIEYQVKNRKVAHLVDDPLAHELPDVLWCH